MLCLVLAINLLLILINPSSTDISNTNVYGAKGKSIELKVEKQPGGAKIRSIIWKHGKDKAAEWFEEDQEPPIKFGIFKTPSTSLDQDEWSLIISDLQSIFSGVYSAEVNNKDPTQSVTLTVIEAVSKPEVTKECIPESTNCTLTCKGTGDGPTLYSWNDNNYGPVLTVKSEDQDVLYTCNFSNPVSWETNSVSVPRTITTSASTTGGIIAAVILFFLFLLVLAVVFLCKKNIVRPCWGLQRGYRINYKQANHDEPKEQNEEKSAGKLDYGAGLTEGSTTNGPGMQSFPKPTAQSGGDQSVVNMDEAGSSEGLTTNGQEEQNEDKSAGKLDNGAGLTEGSTTKGPGMQSFPSENEPTAQSGGYQSVVNMDEAGSSEGLTTNGQEEQNEDKSAGKLDNGAGLTEGSTTKGPGMQSFPSENEPTAQSGGYQSVVNMDEAGSSEGLTTNGQEPKEQNVEDETAGKLDNGAGLTEGPTTNGPEPTAQSGGDQSVVNMDEAGSSEGLTTNGQAKSEGEQQDKTAEHEPSEDQPTS
ncbi:uncharacterized protein LOC143100347 isoform X4 [Alosa pseudoharengus]|uniref:uncharacterized protein LOC143100347 isoform X4 n=1 Tax=Alosa pseudoharengus TaxID=34774 RepID=UPI003F88C19B